MDSIVNQRNAPLRLKTYSTARSGEGEEEDEIEQNMKEYDQEDTEHSR